LFVHDRSSGLEAALEMLDFGPVRRQRCIFHKLRNVVRDVLGTDAMSRVQKQERVTAVLTNACAVYEAPTTAQARERAAASRVRWGEEEAKAVATLERDFVQTLTYHAVAAEARTEGSTWLATYPRTTSGLEQFNVDRVASGGKREPSGPRTACRQPCCWSRNRVTNEARQHASDG
jgi:hypothetical protein